LNATEYDLLAKGAMDSIASNTNPYIKVAMISDKEDITKLLYAHNATAKKGAWQIEIFESVNEAEEWLQS